MTNCPHCGKLVDPNLDNCPYCGGFLRPREERTSQPTERETSQTCPNCAAFVQAGDIICVACGTNLLTGQKVTESQAKAPQKKRPIPWPIIGGVIAAIVVIGIVIAVIAILTRDPVAHAMRLAQEGRTTEATEILEDHLANNQSDLRAFYELGRLYWRANRMSDAAMAFLGVVELDSDRRDAALLAATAYASTSTGSAEEQLGVLRPLVQENPDDVDAWKLIAYTEAKRGNTADQIEALKNVVRLEPSNAEAHMSLAIAYALDNDYERARDHLGNYEVLEEVSAEGLAVKGALQYLNNQEQLAEESLRGAAEQAAEGAAPLLFQLALLNIADGAYDDAFVLLDRVLAENERNDAAKYFRAVAMKETGMTEEALSEFGTLMDNSDEWGAEAALRSAEIYLAQGNLGSAQSAADRAQRMGGAGAPLYTVQGRIMMAEGDPAGALARFNRATSASPNYAPAYLETGLAYVQRGMTTESVRALEKYLQLADPNLPGTRRDQVRALVDQLKTAMSGRA